MRIEIPHQLAEHPPYTIKVRRMGTMYLVNKTLGIVAKKISPRKWEILVRIPGHVTEKAKVIR